MYDTMKFKYIAKLVTEKTDDTTNQISLDLIESNATGRRIDYPPGYTPFAGGDGMKFSEGDVLFGKLRPYLAKVYQADAPGSAFGDIHIYKPKENVIPRFLLYIVINPSFIKLVSDSSYGSKMPRASWNFISDIKVPFPPLKTQQRIVDYLDGETARIDNTVGEMRTLVNLLQEKRRVLISEVVTKGIPGEHAKLKTVRFKNLAFLKNEKSGFSNNQISLENIESGATGKLLNTAKSEPYGAGEGIAFEQGDVLFGKLRPYLAKIHLAKDSGIAFGDIYVYKVKENVLPDFLFYSIANYKFVSEVNNSSYGSKMPRASWKFISNIKMFLPSKIEQQRIVKYLDEETSKIDTLVKETEKAIELLQEERKALIREVVTGQLEV